jgi:parallel beta-helix repeat protein
MKVNLGLLLSSLLIFTALPEKRSQAALRPVTRLAQASQTIPKPSGTIVYAKNFKGADLGARINAADQALGANRGWIVAEAGTISTQVRLNPGHKLKLGNGRFELVNSDIWTGSIYLESDTAVYGEGAGKTIIVEPENAYICIASVGTLDAERGYTATGIRQNIELAGFTIEGRNKKAEGGVRSTIQLGNAHHVHIYNVHLRDTTCLGISAGGTGLTGKYADDWIVEDCTFEGVASQNLNVVNGQRVIFRRNKFLRPGKICGDGKPCEGVTPIDVEPNTSADVARDITIEDNLIDSSNSRFLHGNGIIVQNGAKASFGNVIVRRNKIIGYRLDGPADSNMASGIYLFGVNDVTVSENEVARAAHSGIRVESSTRVTIERNKLLGTGTGGILSFEVKNTTDSKFRFNRVQRDGLFGRGLLTESGDSDRNIYEGNVVDEAVNLVGKGSRVIN